MSDTPTKKETDAQAFERLARPLMEYICDHEAPHTTIIITGTTAEVLSGEKSLGQITDYVKD